MLYLLSGPQEAVVGEELSRCLSSTPSENVFGSDRMEFDNEMSLSSARSLTRTIESDLETP